MPRRIVALLLVFQICFIRNCSSQNMEVILEWAELEFLFPSDEIEENAMESGDYVPENVILIGVDAQYQATGPPRIFITTPRMSSGVPASLSTVSNVSGTYGPKLRPYPDYSWHSSQGSNCSNITSAYRMAIDSCNRLWVIDSGIINDVFYCNPQILIFDLSTDELQNRYVFPDDQLTNTSELITIVVNVEIHCWNTYAYIADDLGYGLLVYSLNKNSSFRIDNKRFAPEEQYTNLTIAGVSFTLDDGLFGMAVTPEIVQRGNYLRFLYFHAFATLSEYRIIINAVNNEVFWSLNYDWEDLVFKKIGERPSQSTVEVMDSKGNLYFALLEEISIVSWDGVQPYEKDNFKTLAQNDTTLQFPSGMKVIRNMNYEEELWVATNRYQKIATGTLTNTEINYRILKCTIEQLQSGQGC